MIVAGLLAALVLLSTGARGSSSPLDRQEGAEDAGSAVQVASLLLMSEREVSLAQLPLIDDGKTLALFRLDELAPRPNSEQMRAESLGTGAEWQQIARSTGAEVELEEEDARPNVERSQESRRPARSSGRTSLNVTSGASNVLAAEPDSSATRAEPEEEEAQLSDLDVHGRLACAFVADTAGRIHRFKLQLHPAESGAPTSGRSQPIVSRLDGQIGVAREARQLTARLSSPQSSRVIWSRADWLAGSQSAGGAHQQPRAADRPAAVGWQNSTKLALDWANNLLFVLTADTLLALDLDGRNQLLLIDDFQPSSRPLDIKVDPATNFLFWLTPGRFHNTIYRLDLAGLLEHKSQALLAERQLKPNQALLSHRLAQPIVSDLPKYSTLFVVDHQRARIYVPFVANLSASEPADLDPAGAPAGKPVDAEVFGSAQDNLLITHMNASLQAGQDSASADSAGLNCTLDSSSQPADGLILAYNLDGTDVGPLRSAAEKANLAGLTGMRDLALDQRNNLLYWLTASGSEIFEEYKVDKDAKFYSAIHSVDGAKVYRRLVHYDPANQLASDKQAENRSSLRSLMDALAGSSTANRWVRSGNQELLDEPSATSAWNTSPLSILGLALFAVICVAIIFQRSYKRQRAANSKASQSESSASPASTINERHSPYTESDVYYGAQFSSLVKLSSWPTNLDYMGNKLYIPTEFHQDEALNAITRISIDQLAIERRATPLGEGHFGTVMRGVISSRPSSAPSSSDTGREAAQESRHYLDEQTDTDNDGYLTPSAERTFNVAIKKLKENASQEEKRDFLQEAKLLANFDHPNVVKLIGICLDRGSTLIIMELMLGGDLTRYMKECIESEQPDECLTSSDLLSICIDIANGCCYLERLNFIHRDLAARNCLVSSKKRHERVVKLADFGLARDIYKDSYYKKLNDSAMPLKWMAPECLIEQKFTTKSDVWSFGVVMWEVMSYCQDKPYASVVPNFMREYLAGGERLSKPKSCSEQMYDLMNRCWKLDPNERPSFLELKNSLLELREDEQNFI